MRFFCFPYAGGGASVYRDWTTVFSSLEVLPLQFPGRENRLLDPPFTRLDDLVETLAEQMLSFLDRPFAFFGHSMGALVCFELARYLHQHQGLLPKMLYVSAHRAPHLPDRHVPIHLLPDQDFIQCIRRFNGTPEEILRSTELMRLLLPTLRADFALSETYQYASDFPLPCSLSVFGGLDDSEVNVEELQAWNKHTSGLFTMHLLPGNHFFIHTARMQIIQVIESDLTG
jgi:medium-chain acyl-[acyl-carrier-protein] hydrolase